MKIERMNFGRLLAMVAGGMLLYAGVAYPQMEYKTQPPIQLHRVNDKSPAVNLSAVGKEVSPGVFEVDPNSVSSKRLVIDGKARHVCLGKWITTKQGPTCEGTWVE